MHCIFCKRDSSTSISIEHIVPESLGNLTHVLPAGVVCDVCNQYFARKIERPLLESPVFRLLRADMSVPNKRGRVPAWEPKEGIGRPSYRTMGRFLAKVGLEVLALRTLGVPGWNEELVEHQTLNELRRFVRYNEGGDWPFNYRTLYPVNAIFEDGTTHFQLLHEFDLLMTRSSEIYLVISLFGVEMTINLGGREIDGYMQWLMDNGGASPLYVDRSQLPIQDEVAQPH